jgi:membrane-bound lytic murein transglycosylase A
VAVRPALQRDIGRLVALGIILIAVVAVVYVWRLTPPSTEPPVSPEQADARQLKGATFGQLRGWGADDHALTLVAFQRSCASWRKAPDNKSLKMAGTVADWRGVCDAARAVAANVQEPEDEAGAAGKLTDKTRARAFFETWFEPFEVSNNGDPEGLFTAYFQIEVDGRRGATDPLQVPLYARPPDLVQVDLGKFRAEYSGRSIAGRVEDGRLHPYLPRRRIDQGALNDQNLELVWVDNPVDAFFLHIQGSGRVRLPDGDIVRVGYDGTNGHSYTTVGNLMVKRGLLPPGAASMQGIRQWIGENPKAGAALMAENARYVFFRLLDGDEPIGAQGVALTAGRSLAVDRKFLPLGVPLWLDTTAPGIDGAKPAPFRRLMVAQDTGSAITGPVRGDIYWGTGAHAGAVAGRMNFPGRYFVLLPKPVALQINGLMAKGVLLPPCAKLVSFALKYNQRHRPCS